MSSHLLGQGEGRGDAKTEEDNESSIRQIEFCIYENMEASPEQEFLSTSRTWLLVVSDHPLKASASLPLYRMVAYAS